MLDYRKNSFNLIRLLAALQVFVGHAVAHLKINYSFKIITLFQGVPIFFFLSGFLIWSSIGRTSEFGEYIKKRVLRVYPELWIGVALSIVSILVLYIRNVDWVDLGLFTITQSTVLQFWTPDSLRGFGCGTPNGSLWTIGVIIQFYLLAWPLHKLLKKKRDWIILILFSVVLNVIYPELRALIPSNILLKLFGQTVFPYLWIFLFGGLVWSYRESIVPFLKKFWWVALCIMLVAKYAGVPRFGAYDLLNSVCLFALITGFAYKFYGLNVKYDISYGIYIYHMIVINVLIELNIIESWYAFLLALVITALLAIASCFINSRINIRLGCRK